MPDARGDGGWGVGSAGEAVSNAWLAPRQHTAGLRCKGWGRGEEGTTSIAGRGTGEAESWHGSMGQTCMCRHWSIGRCLDVGHQTLLFKPDLSAHLHPAPAHADPPRAAGVRPGSGTGQCLQARGQAQSDQDQRRLLERCFHRCHVLHLLPGREWQRQAALFQPRPHAAPLPAGARRRPHPAARTMSCPPAPLEANGTRPCERRAAVAVTAAVEWAACRQPRCAVGLLAMLLCDAACCPPELQALVATAELELATLHCCAAAGDRRQIIKCTAIV